MAGSNKPARDAIAAASVIAKPDSPSTPGQLIELCRNYELMIEVADNLMCSTSDLDRYVEGLKLATELLTFVAHSRSIETAGLREFLSAFLDGPWNNVPALKSNARAVVWKIKLSQPGDATVKPLTETAIAQRSILRSPPANPVDSVPLQHIAAYAMLGIHGKTAKEASAIMTAIRRTAGGLLKCEKAGNRWTYDPASWDRIVKLIRDHGGVENFAAPDLNAIAEKSRAIREQNNLGMRI